MIQDNEAPPSSYRYAYGTKRISQATPHHVLHDARGNKYVPVATSRESSASRDPSRSRFASSTPVVGTGDSAAPAMEQDESRSPASSGTASSQQQRSGGLSDVFYSGETYAPLEPQPSRAKREKTWKQWARLSKELNEPYLELLRCTDNLRITDAISQDEFTCACKRKEKEVTMVDYSGE